MRLQWEVLQDSDVSCACDPWGSFRVDGRGINLASALLGAMLAAIMFFWVADREFALKAVNTGREKKIGAWFLVLGKYVLVPLAFVALVAGALLGGIG